MTCRSRIALAVVLLPVAIAGCSSESTKYPVTGVVTLDGAPAPLVIIRFHPAEPDSVAGGSAHTDPTGKFTIGETGNNTGLPSGEYKVTFSQTLVNGKPTLAGSGGKASEKLPSEQETVADEYRDPKQTPITATVGGGTNNFAFEIKAKK
jgi:hypothetical protein